MKLWRFSDPGDFQYARASRRGSWEGSPPRRVTPLVIEWEPDSDVIGDFSWPGFDSDIIVTERVVMTMKEAAITGFELAPVEMVENSERAKRTSRRTRVKLPYVGPRIWELWVTEWAQLDRERSALTVTQIRGAERYEASGVEYQEAVWDPQRMALFKKRHPRLHGQGLYVRAGTAVFRIPEFPAWVFCTDDVKKLIERHRFTNVSFLEMGDVLDPFPFVAGN
jgi:hypothetical protein